MQLQLHETFPHEMAEEWNALLAESVTNVPFLRHEYLENWWQTRGGGEWSEYTLLYLITAREDSQDGQPGALIGIAPFFHCTIPGRSMLIFLGAIEISDYLDYIVRPADHERFLTELMAFIATQPGQEKLHRIVEYVDMHNLLDSSPTLAVLETLARKMRRYLEIEPLQHCPYIPLPGDWEAYLGSIDKKQRHEIRRKMRRAAEALVATRWYTVSDPAALDDEMEAFFNLMVQDEDKARFLTPRMRDAMRQTARAAMQNGYLHLSFYEIDGKKAAAYFCFDYLNRIWVYNSGIDRSFTEYSPGWVLLGELLKWANENHREAFDFMRGDEDYKYRFGAIDRSVKLAQFGGW